MTEHVSSKSFPSSSSPSKVSPSRPALGLSKQSRPKSKSLQPCLCTFQGCGKTFSKRSNLKAHLRVHTGALPYPCEFQGCQKRFRWKSSLKPHVKIHMKSGDVPRKDCSAFVYGLISSLSKELGPCNESEISGTEEDGANSQNPFIAAGGADNNAPEENLDDDSNHPDFVSCNSSASVAGTQETSPMFSVARKPGRLNTANNVDAHSAPSPTSVTDLHVFDMPYACPEFGPTTDECMEPFSKGCVRRNATLSPTLHLIPAFLPQGMLHCGEHMQSCARVLFQGPSSEEEDESDSSQGMPPFQPAQEYSHPMAQSVKQVGAATEMDLHCNSVLSSSQCSSDNDMLSLTLDSMPVADVQGAGNPFWKGDTPLFDSLEVPFEEFADIDLLPEDAPVV